jgi:large subunit ribosomal protein L4
MNVTVYSLTDKQTTTVLPEAVFNHPVSERLLAQAIRVYLSNQRQGTKKVKTRGEVSYSTRKIWKQKGTGRARHGSRKAPIFVGGGVAHGPTGLENYTLKLTKKMRRSALYGALTVKAQAQAVSVVDDLSKLDRKTKTMTKLIATLKVKPSSRVLLILDHAYPAVIQAAKNLKNIQPTQVSRLNVYEILNHPNLVFTQKSLSYLENLATPKVQSTAPKTKVTKKSQAL